MKKIYFLILLCCLAFPQLTLAQWANLGTGLAPAPSGKLSIWGLGVVDSNTVWALPVNPQTSSTLGVRSFARTIDGGNSWTTGIISNDIGYLNFHVFALDADTAWVILSDIANNQQRAKLYKTTDGGTTWDELLGPFNNNGHHIDKIHFFDRNVGIAYGSPGNGTNSDSLRIYRTVDGGVNWSRIHPSQHPAPLGREVIETLTGNNNFDTNGDILWFGTTKGRVWKTVNRGLSWTAAATGINANIVSVQFKDSLHGLAMHSWGNPTPECATTTNGGATWTVNPAPHAVRFMEYIPGTANTYIAHTVQWPLADQYLTQDGGLSWQRLHYAYPIYANTMVFLSPTQGFAGTWVDKPQKGGTFKWVGDLRNPYTRCDTCLQVVNTFPHKEDFEGEGGSWCQTKFDEINWTLNSGATVSGGTGPNSASDGDYYVFLESDNPNFNKTGSLVSPCFELDSNCIANPRFIFSYNMNGITSNSIGITLSTDMGQTWSNMIWSDFGNKGANWIKDTLDLSPYLGQTIRLKINGVTGSSNQSDLAIDGLEVHADRKLQLTYTQQDVLCHGDSTGYLQTNISGGKSPFTYFWSNGGSQANQNHLPAGTYSLTVRDSNRCEVSEHFNVQEPSALTITTYANQVACFGQNNGSASVQASGGTGNHSYLWSTGANTTTLNNLGPGTYQVTVTDNNGCTKSDSAEVIEPQPLGTQLQLSNISCPGDSNGQVISLPVGGTPPYSFGWSVSGNDSILSNLSPGRYTYILSDHKNCFVGGAFSIGEPDSISLTFSAQDVTCFGDQSGTLKALPTGGNGGYAFLWSNGEIVDSIGNLDTGVYIVQVIDSLGCMGIDSILINQPDELILSLSGKHETMPGAKDGEVSLSIMGGVPPYQFLWNNGWNVQNLRGLPGDSLYSVSVTDANGCQVLDSIFLDNVDGLEELKERYALSIYPNPGKNYLTIHLFSQRLVEVDISIYDMLGKSHLQKNYPHTLGENRISLDVSPLPSGTYLIEISDGKVRGFMRWLKM